MLPRTLRRQAAAAALAMTMALCLGAGCRSRIDAVKEQAVLKQAAAEWDRSFNAGQLTDLMSLYSGDVISMPNDAPTTHGLQAEQASFEKLFAENANVRHETNVDEILVTNEWAIERAHYRMTYTPKSTGKQLFETGRHVMCRKRVGARWRIVWEIWNSDRSAGT